MGIFNLFSSNTDDIVVTTLTSRGATKRSIDITVWDIKHAVIPETSFIIEDEDGFENELLVYLREY